jgi:UDP-glucose 4-epimerase
MKLLVTGGAGFIGSHLVDALIQRGDEVVVLDDFSTGSKENLERFGNVSQLSLVQGNILDKRLVAELMSQVDGCFHMAAAVGVQKILKDPIGSIKTNVHGTENILDQAASLNVPVLLASTSEVYGKNPSESLSEDSDRILGSPLLSRWTYSEAKALDESYAYALHKHGLLKVKIARYFNTVGPRQSPAYGMVIPRFFRSALKGDPLIVHGEGEQRRVFCHVSDAVSATLGLWGSDYGFGEAFNIGGEDEVSVLDLAKQIIEITSSTSKIEFLDYESLRANGFEDIPRRIPNTSKLRSLINWKPNYGINEILSDIYLSLVRPR